MEKQHPCMSPLHVFVQLHFSSLLRSLCRKLWWKYILFQFHYYVHYIVIKFSFSYHCYVHYAMIKTKSIIFLVNNQINFATTFTTPGSWKITYFYFTTTITTFTTAWFWQKNILFWLSPLLFFYYIHVFYYLHHVMIKIILFSFLYCVIRHDQKKKINLVTTFTTPRP